MTQDKARQFHHTLFLSTKTTGKHESELIEVAWERTIFNNDGFNDGNWKMPADGWPVSCGKRVQTYTPTESVELTSLTGHVIGHNIDYHWRAIGSPTDVKRICTLALARLVYPNLDSYELGELIYLVDRKQAFYLLPVIHDTEHDIYLCKALLAHLLHHKNMPKCRNWEEVWDVSELARAQ